jgi:hypothetical protein
LFTYSPKKCEIGCEEESNKKNNGSMEVSVAKALVMG